MPEDLQKKIGELEEELAQRAQEEGEARERQRAAETNLAAIGSRKAELQQQIADLQSKLEDLEPHKLTYEITIRAGSAAGELLAHYQLKLRELEGQIQANERARATNKANLTQVEDEQKEAETELNEAKGGFGEAVAAKMRVREELDDLRAQLAEAHPTPLLTNEQLEGLVDQLGERHRAEVKKKIKDGTRDEDRDTADWLRIITTSRRSLDPAVEEALRTLKKKKNDVDKAVEKTARDLNIVSELFDVVSLLRSRFRGAFAGHILEASYSAILKEILDGIAVDDLGEALKDDRGFADRVSRGLDKQVEKFLEVLLDDFFKRQGIAESVATDELRKSLVRELRPRVLQRVAA